MEIIIIIILESAMFSKAKALDLVNIKIEVSKSNELNLLIRVNLYINSKISHRWIQDIAHLLLYYISFTVIFSNFIEIYLFLSKFR
jgi:hypothetical protein